MEIKKDSSGLIQRWATAFLAVAVLSFISLILIGVAFAINEILTAGLWFLVPVVPLFIGLVGFMLVVWLDGL